MSEAWVWMRQARSDLDCAAYLLDRQDGDPCFCHIAAKAQQCVEKAIKALLRARRIQFRMNHQPSEYLSALRRVRRREERGFVNKVCLLFNQSTREAIKSLESVAPRGGNQARRNTEYPFLRDGEWLAPCDSTVFTREEVKRHVDVSGRISREGQKILSALRLMQA